MLVRFSVTITLVTLFFSVSSLAFLTDSSALTSAPSEVVVNNLSQTSSSGDSTILELPLTLERAINIALANNPELAAAKWDVSAADSRLNVVRSSRWPTLSAEGGYLHTQSDQRLIAASYNGEPGVFDNNFYRGDLVLRLPLFTGGRITNEINVAELLRNSKTKLLARTRKELIFNVSSTFYSMLGQNEVLRSLEFSTSTMAEHHKQVSELLAVQKAAKVDLLRTEVRLAELQQDLLRERNVFAIEKRLLANLLGVDDNHDSFSIAGKLTFEALPNMTAEDLTLVALKRRDDYLAAKDNLEAQVRQVAVAKAGHWPTVSLLGSYGVRIAGSGESEDLGNIGVGVSVPIFEGGRTVAQVKQEYAGLRAAQERLRKLKLQVRQEVESALLDIQSSSDRINVTRQAIGQAQESLRIERMKYDLRSGSMTDMLDTQSALLQSETNYARALTDFRIAMERLALVTGENSI